METLLEMFRRRDFEGIWKRYCGFLDLTTREFQQAQDRLLVEQLPVWGNSSLVRRIFGGEVPASLQEFRDRAPLTTYEDYADALLARNEKELAEPACEWIHTSGRSGQYEHKWIPVTDRMYREISDAAVSVFIHGTATRRGEIRIRERDRMIFALAPLPFISGLAMRAIHEQFNFRIWPPYEQAIHMDYFPRIREAIRLSYVEGLDYFWGITSLAIAITEQFENAGKAGRSEEVRALMRNPKVLLRLARGKVKARIRGGPLRPRDIWNVKGVLMGGMDTAIFRERIRALWGQYPHEGYGCTEFGYIAHTHYAGTGLVMRHTSAYFEFLELDDYLKWKENRSYRPRLRLLGEVEPGREYAIIGSNFHGGVLVRYVLGDSLTFLSRSDEAAGVHVPQFVVSSRIDDVIDIASFTRLTERTVWTAVEESRVPYVDWVVTKEAAGEKPVLHLYLEPRGDSVGAEQIQRLVHEKLKDLDEGYRNLEEMAGIRPLEVTLLSPGTFDRYLQERQAAGYDLAHSKPVHMNPKGDVVARLISMSTIRI